MRRYSAGIKKIMSDIHYEEKINSHPQPFDGQSYRSSGDFSTRYIRLRNGKKPPSLEWTIKAEGSDKAGNISFQVRKDVVGGIDKTEFNDARIKNGTVTPFIGETRLYISSPQGAKNSFDVIVSGLDCKPPQNMLSNAGDDIDIESENINDEADE